VILEVALLNVREECVMSLKQLSNRQSASSSMPGYLSHELHKCIEVPTRYILLVRWKTLKDHTVGFRQSDEYQKRLLHHFYDPFPTVEHFELVTSYLA